MKEAQCTLWIHCSFIDSKDSLREKKNYSRPFGKISKMGLNSNSWCSFSINRLIEWLLNVIPLDHFHTSVLNLKLFCFWFLWSIQVAIWTDSLGRPAVVSFSVFSWNQLWLSILSLFFLEGLKKTYTTAVGDIFVTTSEGDHLLLSLKWTI